MSHLRKVALLFAALALLMAGSAQAAGPLTYADDEGDSLDGRGSMDIVSITYDMRQVNKSGPPSLVVEMELAAPPETQLASYTADADIEGCGYFQASFRPGSLVFGAALNVAPADFFIECGGSGEPEILPAQFRIDGNVLRWSLAVDGLPKSVKAGGTLGGLNAYSQIAEPITGVMGSAAVGPAGATDSASTDKTWSFGN